MPVSPSLAIIEEGRAIELATRYFGGLPGGSPATRPWTPAVGLDRGDVDLVLHDRVELDRVYLAWHTAAQFEPDDAPLSLLSDILARGRSSRLYRRLVVEEGIAQDVSSYQSGRELAGTFGVTVTLRPGRSPEEARDRIVAEIAAMARGRRRTPSWPGSRTAGSPGSSTHSTMWAGSAGWPTG